ncbi:MAG: macro domain-containing protein [Cetobacterium sp.]
MLKLIQGNIFDSKAVLIVNPVNTEGVMGKGLAYQFKIKFPLNFKNYYEACKKNEVDIGKDMNATFENDKWVINFPTKRHWKENSKLFYITEGLKKLKEFMENNKIYSVAIPPLGAGNGKLDWNLVKEEIYKFYNSLDQEKYTVFVYEPTLSEMKLNKMHLLILKFILRSYEKNIKKEELTDLVFQKIVYIYDSYFGENYFKFEKDLKGPFSKLINIAYGDLKQYSRTTSTKLKDIETQLEKKLITNSLKEEEKNIDTALKIYLKMKQYFGLNCTDIIVVEKKIELMATIIFIINSNNKVNQENIFEFLKNWNERKEKMFTYEDCKKICEFLIYEKLIFLDNNENYSTKKPEKIQMTIM